MDILYRCLEYPKDVPPGIFRSECVKHDIYIEKMMHFCVSVYIIYISKQYKYSYHFSLIFSFVALFPKCRWLCNIYTNIILIIMVRLGILSLLISIFCLFFKKDNTWDDTTCLSVKLFLHFSLNMWLFLF